MLERFNAFCNHPITGSELEEAIRQYFTNKVRTQRRYPHFVYHEINGENIIHGHHRLAERLASSLCLGQVDPALNRLASYPVPSLHKEQKLLRIIDLNNLRYAYRWLLDKRHRRRRWKDSFNDYYEEVQRDWIRDEKKEQQWINDWHDRMLDPSDPDRRDSFVIAVLEMLNYKRRDSAFQPTWATVWQAFEAEARTEDGEANADRWVQLMGMGKNEPGHWYIALTYTVAEAGTLARPTQLDGGWYEYHFPSPKEAPLEFGGHAMDLHPLPTNFRLLPEYIHKQIEHPIKHWDDTGRLLGRTSDWDPLKLINLRRAHQKRLKEAYDTDAYTSCPNRNACKIC